MTASSSVVGGWSVAVTRALNSLGYDGAQLLRDAGVDPHVMYDPDARFTSDHTRALWRLAVAQTERGDIGLEVAKFVCPTTFHALGFSLWASSHLKDALDRIVRYEVLLNDGCALRLDAYVSEIELTMEVRARPDNRPSVAAEGVDYFLAAVVKIFRDIHDLNYRPNRVYLCRPAPKEAQSYRDYFGCEVVFSAAKNSLLFDQKSLLDRLPTGNPELAQENDKIVAEYLKRYDEQDLVAQVQARLMENLALGELTQEKMATILRMNLRTLQHRLKQQQTSYKKLLNETRSTLARQYLQQPRIPISEITHLLGFSDPSHFNRAFKRWTGDSPSAFRARLGNIH